MKNKTVAALMAAIALCAALTACGSDSGETSAKISGAPAETAVDTSAKVDELRANAKADAAEATADQIQEAVGFLQDNVYSYFSDSGAMVSTIYYGAFLEACYNGTGNDYEQVGLQAQKTVESVYRGEKRTSDSATQENLKALRTMVEALPDAR